MTALSVRSWVEEYLAYRRGLGFKLDTVAVYLRSFTRYAEQVGHHGPLTLDLATRWALQSRSGDAVQAARRLAAIRPFVQHRVLIDPATEIPSVELLGRAPARRKPPHIYSDTEICALLQQAAQMLPRGGLRPRTYVTFFSLLFSTGLRVSEACHLTCGDVDFERGLLKVQGSKFRKSRWVPLHPSAARALECYAACREETPCRGASTFFFRTEHLPRLTYAAVVKAFSRIRRRLGWTSQGRARRPHIHDARHTFAVRRLLQWYEEGSDVAQKLLSLSTYLGHAQVTDTYWYLSAVPELLAIASRRFERLAQQAQERTP